MNFNHVNMFDRSASLIPSPIDPRSGLASDYLNQFYEVLLLLDHVGDDPSLLEDLAEWSPLTYCAHLDNSALAERERMILAYSHALPVIRRRFEHLADETAASVTVGVNALLRLAQRDAGALKLPAKALANELRATLVRMDAMIRCHAV